ncbi:golgin-45 [Sorex araneus]|uniref:golgin-45 n=1 Tax=Sorex araneus TaxID=42254 RepID=UPI0003318C93|nr:golgin-45 [Sorex araneus]XP_054975885.1 golgin-45 [Sorex araneus]
MATLEGSEAKAALASTPVRGAGDGMEMEEPPKLEVTPGGPAPRRHLLPSPRKRPGPADSPGVVQLGPVPAEGSLEVEAVRIWVPKAAITHHLPAASAKAPALGRHRGEGPAEGSAAPGTELSDAQSHLERLEASERRLREDREGLASQLRVQTEVNRELKKLLVASVGDDLQYHFERLAREKNQLLLENEAAGRRAGQLSEQLERLSIQGDVWRSKFLASRVMAHELAGARATLQRQSREAQGALQDLLSEREHFRQEMAATHRLLEELLVSLQWGREPTYQPGPPPHSTAELAAANHGLARAISAHLLGDVRPPKGPGATEFSSSPAEKMAETVLRLLDPAGRAGSPLLSPRPEPTPAALLASKNIGRFHPYTRYENITFNCCAHCRGDLLVL